MNLGETLSVAGHAIEDVNEGRLDGVLSGTNWNDETKLGGPANRERIIRSLNNHFGDLDLRDENLRQEGSAAGNVLGDAYDYLIYQFADDAGRKGGEFYTPRSVVRLIVELVQPKEGMHICDPAPGSAGMLIYTANYVREQGGEAGPLEHPTQIFLNTLIGHWASTLTNPKLITTPVQIMQVATKFPLYFQVEGNISLLGALSIYVDPSLFPIQVLEFQES